MPDLFPHFDGDDDVPNNLEKPLTVKVCSGSIVGGLPRYSWVQQAFDPGTASYLDMVSPRRGTENLKEINDINMLSGTPFYADARLLGIVSGNLFYQFVGASGMSGGSSSGTSCQCCTSGSASGAYICISGLPDPVPSAYSGGQVISGVPPISIIPPPWSGSQPVSGLPPPGTVPPAWSGSIPLSGSPIPIIVPPPWSGSQPISGFPVPVVVPPGMSGSQPISGFPVPVVVPPGFSGSQPVSGSPIPIVVPPGFSGSRPVSGFPVPVVVPPGMSGWPPISGLPPIGIIPPSWSGGIPIPTSLPPIGFIPWGQSGWPPISGLPPIGIIPPSLSGTYVYISGSTWPGLSGSTYVSGSNFILPPTISGFVAVSGSAVPAISGSVVISGYGPPVPPDFSGFIMKSGSITPLVSGASTGGGGAAATNYTGVANGSQIFALHNGAGLHGTIAIWAVSGPASMLTDLTCNNLFGSGGTNSGSVLHGTITVWDLSHDAIVNGLPPPYTDVSLVIGSGAGYNVWTSILG